MVALLHVRPYLFDREFQDFVEVPPDAPAEELCLEEEERTVPPPPPSAPTFSEEELAAACAVARADGERAGRTAAERSSAARIATVLATISDQLQTAGAQAAKEQAAIVRDATAIALTICRKLMPQTYRETAGEEIAQLLSTVLPRIFDQPQVVVRVAGALAQEVSAPVASVVESAGFAGTVRVVADDTLAEGDCRIEWSQGGVIRDATTLLREIETVIDQSVGRHPGATIVDVLPPTSRSADATPKPKPVTEAEPAAGRDDSTQVLNNPSQRADPDA